MKNPTGTQAEAERAQDIPVIVMDPQQLKARRALELWLEQRDREQGTGGANAPATDRAPTVRKAA